MTATDIELRNLHDNDYNPRKRFDDAPMADLKESIERVGLVQPLTVRENEGGYEVVSGIRRLKALREVHGEDSDEPIPCNVRELNDDAAKWVAIAENLAREDLTPVEEARVYANAVTVKYREDDDGEPIEETYAEYINHTRDKNLDLDIPAQTNPQVQTLAGRITTSDGTIASRFRLLVLPDDELNAVENGELGVESARRIGEILRHLPDSTVRDEHMTRIAKESIEGRTSLDEIRERANAVLQEWEDRQQQNLERVENFADAATSAESDLRNELKETAEWYNGRADDDLEIDGETTLTDAASTAVEALQTRVSELGGERLTELDDRESDLKRERNRLEQNVEIVREEGHDRCPFCKAGLLIPDIEDRIEEYEREIEAVQEEKEELSEEREAYRERRADLREAVTEFENACSRLRPQLDSADVTPDELDAKVPDAIRNGGAE
jgi:ParB family chromosome partitioning protein